MSGLKEEKAERLSHAYIISSASAETAYARAIQTAAMALCSGEGTKPCGACKNCLKIQKSIHPDIINISRLRDDKGKEKKFITVDQVRELKLDALIAPNEAARKVYIIREAEKMNPEAQNAALKLLEEPPAGVIFILCTDNAGALLTTVRSRCEEISCNDRPVAFEQEILELTEKYLGAVSKNDQLALAEFCFASEGIKPQTMSDFTDSTSYAVTELLCGRRTQPVIDTRRLLHIYKLMRYCAEALTVNGSVKLLFGKLMTETLEDNAENRGK